VLTLDVNGDGRPDLLTVDSQSGTLTLLENRGVAPPNRAPTAISGGPYAGVVGVPVQLHGSQSSDPEGSPLSYRWDFGDGAQGTGPEPVHTYHSGGRFTVSLTVSDGSLEGRDSTTADIAGALATRAFPADGNRPVIVSKGSFYTYVAIEPVGGAYQNADVVLSSIRLQSPGTGIVNEIAAIDGKRALVGDKDGNGIPEISAAFGREDLARLFSNVSGKRQVPVVVEGALTSGAKIRGTFHLTVVAHGGSPFAAASSNPLRPGGTLTLFQERSGPLRVQLFDSSGRLVRTLADQPSAGEGFLDIPIEGGSRLPSGVYFYKVRAATGSTAGRIVVLR